MTFIETSNIPLLRPLISLWTDERIESLKKLWAGGLSASQIADEFNCGFPRNAIIGKVHRLQLETRRVTIRMPDLNHNRPHKRVRFRSIKPVADIAPQMLEGKPAPCPVYSVDSLKKTDCRWPYGDPGTAGFHFCGARKLDGRPYCGPHHRLACQPKR